VKLNAAAGTTIGSQKCRLSPSDRWSASIGVEDALTTRPKVRRAAVIGIPDAKWGELVVVTQGSQLSAEQLITYCRGHLSGYACPKRVEFVGTLCPTQPPASCRSSSCASCSGPATSAGCTDAGGPASGRNARDQYAWALIAALYL
jgi:hypothetical protein